MTVIAWCQREARRDRSKRRSHVLTLKRDLGMGEPQASKAGSGVRLIANPVLCLLGGRAVIPQSVGLDDEPQLRPVEVDLEAVDGAAGFRPWQPRLERDREEQTLELGVREHEGVRVQQLGQAPHAGS
jgi:hypothetical protein